MKATINRKHRYQLNNNKKNSYHKKSKKKQNKSHKLPLSNSYSLEKDRKNMIGGATPQIRLTISTGKLLEATNLFRKSIIESREKWFSCYLNNIEQMKIHQKTYICKEKHEHSLNCALEIDIIQKKYMLYQRKTPIEKIRGGILTQSNIDYNEIDKIERSIFTLLKETGYEDILNLHELLPANILEPIDTREDYGKLVKTTVLYSEILELYQEIVDFFLVSQIFLNFSLEIKNYMEATDKDSPITDKERQFRLGVVPNHIEYVGTFRSYKIDLVDVGGTIGTVLVPGSSRDIFMIDYTYPNLKDKNSTKLPLYASTGTNFSASQKNMLSPFNGFALNNYKHRSKKLDAENLLVQVANLLNIKSEKEKGKGILKYFKSGKLKERGTISKFRDIMPEKNKNYLLYPWLIKMSTYLIESNRYSTKSKLYYSFIEPTYKKFKGRNKVLDFLGAGFIKHQLANGDIKTTNFKKNKRTYFYNVNNPLHKTIEQTLDYETNKSKMRVFFSRFFANRDLYSMRNMAPTSITTIKPLNEIQFNEIIKDNNIFGEDLCREYYDFQTGNTKPQDISNELNYLILSYFIECYLYLRYRQYSILSLDLRKVLDIYCQSKSTENNFTFKFSDDLTWDNEDELLRIIEILKEIGNNIRSTPYPRSLYEDTNFYIFMRQPNYNRIKNPK